MSPDSIVPDPHNPQSLNRFAYAFNNPLRYIDPSGHDPMADWEDEWRQNNPDRPEGPNDTERMEWIKNYVKGLLDADGSAKLQGTALYARSIELLSGKYKRGEMDQFVRGIGFLFAGIHYGEGPMAGLKDAALANFGFGSKQDGYFGDEEGEVDVSDLRSEYLDSFKPTENQMHHYSAFLMASYFLGRNSAIAINTFRDGPLNLEFGFPLFVKWNGGDVRLGNRAAVHANILKGLDTGVPAWSGRGLAYMIRSDMITRR